MITHSIVPLNGVPNALRDRRQADVDDRGVERRHEQRDAYEYDDSPLVHRGPRG